MQAARQCLRRGRQRVLAGRTGDDGGPGEAALPVQPCLDRVQDVGHPLVLVDEQRCGAGHHRRQVASHGLPDVDIIQVQHRPTGLESKTAQHRRLAHRPRAVKCDHRLDRGQARQQAAYPACHQCLEDHDANLADMISDTVHS